MPSNSLKRQKKLLKSSSSHPIRVTRSKGPATIDDANLKAKEEKKGKNKLEKSSSTKKSKLELL